MITIHPIRFAFFVLLGAAAIMGGLALFAACTAHAKVVMDGVPPVVQHAPAEGGLPWAAWLGIGLAALAGLDRVVRMAADLLGAVAKRTPNKVDDGLHDKLDKLADGLDEIVAIVRGVQPAPTVVVNNAPSPEPAADVHTRETSPGVPPVIPLLAVLLIGAAVLQPACSGTSARDRAAAGVKAFLDCEAPHVDAQMLADAKLLAKSAAEKWIGNDGRIDVAGLKSDAQPLKTDLLRCAMDAAIAVLTTAQPAQGSDAPMAAGLTVDAAQVRAAWSGVRAELGWPQAKEVP